MRSVILHKILMLNDIKIRQATLKDSFDIAKIHVDCWRTTYKGIVPDEKLENMSYDKSSEKWSTNLNLMTDTVSVILIADKKGKPVGFCSGGKKRKSSKRTAGYEGEIKAIYILKEYQNIGIGKKLFTLYEEIFRKNNIFSYIIWVLKENDSKNFYKKLGGKLITTKTYEIGGKKLKGLCFGFKIKAEEPE